MKGKIKYYDARVLEYVEKDTMTGEHNVNNIISAIGYLEEHDILPVRQNIERHTGLGKTCVMSHLNKLIKQGRITVQYAKIRLGEGVTIGGMYHLKEYKPKKKAKK